MNKITLIPNDETLFKKQLLLTKLATRIIIYKDGSTKESVWVATKLSSDSDIMRNIMSQSWYRDEKNNIEHAIIIAGCKLNGSSRIDGYKKRGPEQKPVANPWQGKDVETERIKYGNVPEEQQVPQLCRCLEGVYERILAFAREILGDWVDSLSPRRIPIILKKECPSNVYVHKDEYVQRRINELIKCGGEVSLEEMRRILRHTMRIAGRFVSKPKPHIIIYFNQFSSKCWEEYIFQVAQTLAHEYMHYLEYVHCRAYGTTSYKDENVSEALADFFAVLFSIGCNDGYSLAVAKDRYDCWLKWDGSGWPYAHALNFYMVNGTNLEFSPSFVDYQVRDNIGKFIEVFQATPNAKKALDILQHY